MNTIEFYQEQINYHTSLFEKYKKQESLFSFVRLLSFIAFTYFVILIFSTFSAIVGIISIFPAILAFGFILNHHLKLGKLKQKHQYLVEINKLEIDCIQGNYSSFPTGGEFDEKEHPYLNDLDILGKHSIFQYITRTNTQPGALKLANWLKEPAPFNDILQRQEAIQELSKKTNWRQDLRSVFYQNPSSNDSPKTLIDWCNSEPDFKNSTGFLLLLGGLSLITITLFVLWLNGFSSSWLVFSMFINIAVYYKHIKKINSVQSQLSKTNALLLSYSDIIRLIENEQFSSELLIQLKNNLYKTGSTSNALKLLSKLSKKLDYRLNILVGVSLNLFLFWDIHQCLKLEKWKVKYKKNIAGWFDTMAEFEVLSSFANLHFNNADWVFPTITDSYFQLESENAGHPLILPQKRINNSFELNSNSKVALITGSNMSGKSTFLRTLGVNIVLAMAGSPVCATKFNVSYVKIYSSMRISDSLEDNTSSFYAELKKLAQIIKVVENKEKVFLLLDEILRGTNSNDRHTGSVAIIRQLIKNKASAILATHDLGLSYLESELPENIDIYNFDVKIEGEELYFDYKINPGICKSLNASILMKKMGIEV